MRRNCATNLIGSECVKSFFFLLTYKGWKMGNIFGLPYLMTHLKCASDSYQPLDVSRRTQDTACPIPKLHFKRRNAWLLYCSVMLSSICTHTEPIKRRFTALRGNNFTFYVLGCRYCCSSTAEKVKHQYPVFSFHQGLCRLTVGVTCMGIKCCDFRYGPNCVLELRMVSAFGVWSQTGSVIQRLCHCGLGTICCHPLSLPSLGVTEHCCCQLLMNLG